MRALVVFLALAASAAAQSLADEALRYYLDLLKLDTSNPPGNETRVARYLKDVCDRAGVAGELVGPDPDRLNFVARLRGTGEQRPLLLMAHSDVVPAEPSRWTVSPFAAIVKDGYVWGRGAQDTKALLAAELALFLELSRSSAKPKRNVILLAEADEEAGSTGIQWLIANAWEKIDAEFALNEGGFAQLTPEKKIVFNIQTAEKIPTRVKLVARGIAGHGSLPREDNAVLHLAQALVKLTTTEQPIRWNATTREYIRAIAQLPEYHEVAGALRQLENPGRANAARREVAKKFPIVAAMLSTSVSPTMLEAGVKVNVIPTWPRPTWMSGGCPTRPGKRSSSASGKSSTTRPWRSRSSPETNKRCPPPSPALELARCTAQWKKSWAPSRTRAPSCRTCPWAPPTAPSCAPKEWVSTAYLCSPRQPRSAAPPATTSA